MEHFKLYSQYYDLLYGNKDYAAETAYISKLIRELDPAAETILEFGSGTGKHGKLLENEGFKVHGWELSDDMVRLARQHGFSCEQADISAPRSAYDKFDVVISLFHVISYVTDNRNLTATFRNAWNSLGEKGFFIFDVWYTPAVYSEKPESRVKEVSNSDISVWRIAEPEIHPELNVVDVNYSIIVRNKHDKSSEVFSEKHPMRHFSVPEIALLAELTGFRVVRTEEFLTGAAPSQKTWGVCFVLAKS